MILSRANLYGLHKAIYDIQDAIEEYLVWITGNRYYPLPAPDTQVASEDIKIYGKIESNDNIPTWYTGSGDYCEVFLNDKASAEIGFVVKDINELDADVDIVCSVKLNEVHGDSLRNEEKARLELLRAIDRSGKYLPINGVKEGIEDCLSDFDIERYNESDMQPWYVFAIETNIRYKDDYC